MQIVQAILELVFLQRPLIEASNNFAYQYDPPYQWTQSGTVGTWHFTKPFSQGYRFERPDGVVIEIGDILDITVDSIVVHTLVAYLASKGVTHVEIERERIDIRDTQALEALLAQLVTTGLLAQASEGFRLVRHVDLSKAVTIAQELAFEHFGTRLGPISIEAVFRELLWGPRETWQCFVDELITRQEATQVLVQHLDSRLLRPADWSIEWNDSLAFPLYQELSRILPPTGPAAFSIELDVIGFHELQQLSPRTYDPELDNILSILHDVCDHLHEHRIVELNYRIVDTYVPASVRTDLCVVLEQLPDAFAAIAEHRDFEIDNFEQGFETKLAFTAREDDYAMVVTRHWTELPGSHPIRSSELLEMLGRLRTNFMTALRRAAPELEHHPWTRAWLVAVPGG